MISSQPGSRQFRVFLLCLTAVLLWFFWRSLHPNYVVFSNDGPLGAQCQNAIDLPGAFMGVWYDLNFIGTYGGSFSPTLTNTLLWILGPVYFMKFYVPIILFLLAVSVWFVLRRVGLAPVACTLGALAAALNSDFFSTACWGVGPQVVTMTLSFVAIGLLADVGEASALKRWIKVVLAGFAVGMGVMEGADIGALFSLVVALFVVYQALTRPTPGLAKVGRGLAQLTVVALCAAFMAMQALTALIGTQIKGIVGTSQDERTKLEQWDWATQWSLPKREVLGLFVPGLFGYRMDTPLTLPESMHKRYEGGNYWGMVGSHSSWDRHFANPAKVILRPSDVVQVSSSGDDRLGALRRIERDGQIDLPNGTKIKAAGLTPVALGQEIAKVYGTQAPVTVTIQPQSQPRFSGGGGYAGVLVVLVALWAAFQGLRKNSVFTPGEKKIVLFWAVLAFISVLLAFGRFAPFYQFVYALPYFSTIRNPTKFLHIFSFAMVWLFGFGIHGLSRTFLETSLGNASGLSARLKTWWNQATAFDRRWVAGCVLLIVASLIGWFIFASSRRTFEEYLQTVQFDSGMAASIASFALRQVGWFILLLIGVLIAFVLILSGTFAGKRARWAGLLLGALLVIDLVPAAVPWLIFWDYKFKYATNPIIEVLRQKPHEQRAAKIRFPTPPQWNAELFGQLYDIEWIQQLFQYYNIQSLDIIQRSRLPQDIAAFEGAFEVTEESKAYQFARRWQFTNTRYLLGPVQFYNVLNQTLDPQQQRFRIAARFNVRPKPGVNTPRELSELTVEPAQEGLYALFDFTGALPRAKLYSDWQAPANNPSELEKLKAGISTVGALPATATNDLLTLHKMGDPAFDPLRTVLIADDTPVPAPSIVGNQAPGTAEFASYAPKHIVLKTRADHGSVLLLNDKYDPSWRVFVDGKQEPLLRCNFIMRGVYLTPGEHQVEFRFDPPKGPIYVSLAAIAIGFFLVGFLAVSSKAGPQEPQTGQQQAEKKR